MDTQRKDGTPVTAAKVNPDRSGMGEGSPYLPDMYAFLNQEGVWHSQGNMGWFGISSGNQEERSWNQECRAFLAGLDGDDVLVTPDCRI